MEAGEAGRERGMTPDRRRRLLRTAAAEFARAGYERASLNRIIRECAMSKSSFYHFVGSKQELFDAVVADGAGALAGALAVPEPQTLAGDFWAAVAGLLERLLIAGEREPWLTDLGRLFYLDDAPRHEGSALAVSLRQIDGWLADALAVGRAAGAVRDDLPAALQARLTLAVLETMDRWSLRHLTDADADTRRRLAAAQLDTVRRLLAPA